jgi:hypothetical protein
MTRNHSAYTFASTSKLPNAGAPVPRNRIPNAIRQNSGNTSQKSARSKPVSSNHDIQIGGETLENSNPSYSQNATGHNKYDGAIGYEEGSSVQLDGGKYLSANISLPHASHTR